jgi:dTDP-4-dehydrorhamnose 3,5-epimerase
VITEATPLPGVLLLRPRLFRDARGHFLETWARARYEAAGLPAEFVQDNVSVSARGVVRGLHAQAAPHAQGKLVTVAHGAIFDVAVDARPGAPTFGQWYGVELRASEGTQLWIPPGFLHGFQALEDGSVVQYKCTAPYHQAAEFSVRWDDPAIGIRWPLEAPLLSDKDAEAPTMAAVLLQLAR